MNSSTIHSIATAGLGPRKLFLEHTDHCPFTLPPKCRSDYNKLVHDPFWSDPLWQQNVNIVFRVLDSHGFCLNDFRRYFLSSPACTIVYEDLHFLGPRPAPTIEWIE